MGKLNSLEKLFRKFEDGLRIEGIGKLAVVTDDSINSRTDHLEHETLMDAVGAIVDESVEEVADVPRPKTVRGGKFLQLLEIGEFLGTLRSVCRFDLQ